jgi:DNA-binding MarR family transcriptional regulator
MEVRVGDSSTTSLALRLALRDLANLKERISIQLPEHLQPLKDRIPQVESHQQRDYNLFLSISDLLYAHNTLSMSELSEALSVPPNTATRMMDWLVANDYAERLPDPKDRRVVRVRLTSTGRELHEAILSFQQGVLDTALQGLTKKERQTLLRLLQKIARSVSQERVAVSASER